MESPRSMRRKSFERQIQAMRRGAESPRQSPRNEEALKWLFRFLCIGWPLLCFSLIAIIVFLALYPCQLNEHECIRYVYTHDAPPSAHPTERINPA